MSLEEDDVVHREGLPSPGSVRVSAYLLHDGDLGPLLNRQVTLMGMSPVFLPSGAVII